MATKPIIEIDIEDAKFRDFIAKWDEYRESLHGMSAEWQAVNKRVAEFQKLQMAAGVDAGVALDAAMKMEGAYKKVAHQQERGAVATKKASGAFADMAKTTSHIGKGVLSITGHLMKWATVFGAIGAGVGLFGLDRLAGSALGQQRNARGMNVTIGQAAAMKVNMARFFDPDSVMSRVADTQQDPAKWGAFAAMGINPMQAANQSTFKTSLEVARRARAEWMKNPNVQMAQAEGLTHFFSIADLRRMAASPHFDAATVRTRGDVGSLGFGHRVAHEWTVLSVQLARAGQQIEKTLIQGLAPLAPDLAELSKAANDAIRAFLKSPEIKTGIKDLAGGIGVAGRDVEKFAGDITQFAKYLASPKVQAEMATFGTAIGDLARETVNALRFFHMIPQASERQRLIAAIKPPAKPIPTSWAVKTAAYADKHLGIGPGHAEILAAAEAAHKKYPGVSVNELMRLSQIESSGGVNMLGPKTKYGRAQGVWQMLPGTAKAEGVNNPMSASDEAMGTARYLTQLQKQFGTRRAALMAYEAGPGTVAAQIKAHGKNWMESAGPAERKEATAAGSATHPVVAELQRLRKVIAAKTALPKTNVSISNNTGAHVAVSANALAY